jgi:beta-phosphoglucomutase-like phosphatase (HAD superfamily)
MPIRALVFDFDGLIADTEGPEYQAWSEAWAGFGHELTLDLWCAGIGTVDAYDPLEELAARVGDGFDRDATNDRRRVRQRELLVGLTPLPGVLDHLAAATHLGLPIAIASSSEIDWILPNLEALGLASTFAHLSVYDGTCPAKPAPDLYIKACQALGVDAREALAYEDSPNGIAAAKAAGMRCVAVPHDLTRHLDLSAADVVVDSLAGIKLADLLAQLAC